MILAVKHCAPLNAPSHGSKQGSSDAFDSVVTFSCNRGYRLQGSASRKCLADELWDGVEAQCVGQSRIHYVVDNISEDGRKGFTI